MEDEKAAEEFTHGNCKKERSYVRTCPSVVRKLDERCMGNTTAKVYKSEIINVTSAEYLPVLLPKQVENSGTSNYQKLMMPCIVYTNLRIIYPDLLILFTFILT